MLGRREVSGPGETGRSEYGVDGTRGYAPLRFSRCICLNLRILIPDPTCGRSLCFRLMQVYPALRGPRPSIMPSGSPPASHVFGSSPTSETDSTISEEDPMRLTSLTSNLTSGATATILGDLGHKVAIPIPQRLAPIRPSLQLFLPLAPGTGSPQPIQSLFAAHHVLDLDCDQGGRKLPLLPSSPRSPSRHRAIDHQPDSQRVTHDREDPCSDDDGHAHYGRDRRPDTIDQALCEDSEPDLTWFSILLDFMSRQ